MRRNFFLALLPLFIGCSSRQNADLVLFNGKIITADELFSIHSTLAVKDGKVLAVGDKSLLRRFRTERKIDLSGKTVVPGFNDTHQHVRGRPRRHLELGDLASLRDLHSRVQAKAAELAAGEWITGYGWAEDDLAEKRRPLRWDLDKATPKNPVILSRAGAHSAVANSFPRRLGKSLNRALSKTWNSSCHSASPVSFRRELQSNSGLSGRKSTPNRAIAFPAPLSRSGGQGRKKWWRQD